ncbi:hypothetical protein M404DRAFT_647168 [Pisolithus tinctorius Marx 270]|uniref:Uncharacterized protein n=1 Tax=Pisolithus tinctorius Marx 270 TaxID=870435 RepID=A0A0C3J1B2_PISTI|nr:hypothetical protein M404DRAFT_647168 [Pisolithus tinctorius Marx 270]
MYSACAVTGIQEPVQCLLPSLPNKWISGPRSCRRCCSPYSGLPITLVFTTCPTLPLCGSSLEVQGQNDCVMVKDVESQAARHLFPFEGDWRARIPSSQSVGRMRLECPPRVVGVGWC